jgi:uncharacterized protein (DUF1501 family)
MARDTRKTPDSSRTTLSRRSFLGGALALGASAGAFGSTGLLDGLGRAAAASAEGRPQRHYIFCYFNGGWDILLGLDPRNPAVFTNGNAATTRIQPGYELVTTTDRPVVDALGDNSMHLGPFVGEMARHASRICVVRGINMDTLTHEVGRRRFITGRPPSGLAARGSSTDAWFASLYGGQEAIPNLTIGVESYNTNDLPNYATALSARGVEDLVRVLGTPDGALPEAVEARIDALLRRQAQCPEHQLSKVLQTAESSRRKALQMVTQRLESRFDLRLNTPEMVALRARYGITSTSATELASGRARAALAATAIMSGVSRVVSFAPAQGLDTHFDNWQVDHGPRQRDGFNAVARLMDHLLETPYPDGSGDSWFDRTVIVCFSEFSRTPLINANGGRDHWLLNAALVAGGNVVRGRVIGASSNLAMNPLPLNLMTGMPVARDASMMVGGDEIPGEIEVIRPEHILQALYHELGLTHDEPDLRCPPLRALLRS